MKFSVGSGPKFTGPFSSNAEGIALDHMSFRFSISCPTPEIFAIKVWSCTKSSEISHGFGPKIFGGSVPPKFWTQSIKLNQFPIMWQSFTAIVLLVLCFHYPVLLCVVSVFMFLCCFIFNKDSIIYAAISIYLCVCLYRSRELGENLAKEKKKEHHEQNRGPPVLAYGLHRTTVWTA